MVTTPEFQPGQRVRVREQGGAPSTRPEQRWLGKEGSIRYDIVRPLVGVAPLPSIYFVEFDSGEVKSFTPDWLESR